MPIEVFAYLLSAMERGFSLSSVVQAVAMRRYAAARRYFMVIGLLISDLRFEYRTDEIIGSLLQKTTVKTGSFFVITSTTSSSIDIT